MDIGDAIVSITAFAELISDDSCVGGQYSRAMAQHCGRTALSGTTRSWWFR